MAQEIGQFHQLAGILTQIIEGKSVSQQVRSHVQARDLGSTRQALKKRLYGTGRKGTVPITEKQRLARLRFRTQLQICTQGPPLRR